MLQTTPDAEESCLEPDSLIRAGGSSHRWSNPGATLVDAAPGKVEWKTSSPIKARSCLRDRCFPARLGCSLRGDSNRRIVVSGREESITHKLSGVTVGSTSCQDICKESHWCSHPSEDGQHHGHIIHQQDGRYKVIHPVRDGLQLLELVSRKRYLSLGRTPSGHLQCNGRCRISHPTILIGMGAQYECSGSHFQPIGQVRGGSLCNKIESQATPVCKLATRPLCNIATNAFQVSWTNIKGYAFPPFAMIGKCLQKVIQDKGHIILIAPVYS